MEEKPSMSLPKQLTFPLEAFEEVLRLQANKTVGKTSPKLFCKEYSYKNHKLDCKCFICKSKRGEYKGKNNPNWKGNKAVHKQSYYCIKGCLTKITSQTFLYGKGMCIKCANKKTNTERKWLGKNNPAYIDGRSLGKYYCIDCEIKGIKVEIGWQTWFEGSKKCRSCSAINKLKNPKNHPNYLDGLDLSPYSSEFNSKLKEHARERDNYICQNCGMTEEEHLIVVGTCLHCHHIDYNKQNSNINNLITLCNSCHVRSNYNRKYWEKYYTNMTEDRYGLKIK
jgi:hypothetical protein